MKLILVAFCTVFAAIGPINAVAASEEVVQMLSSFYKWYVPHLDQKPGTKSDHQMSDFVTERLIKQVDRLREPEKDGVAKLDWDPYVNAQDYEPDWATKVSVRDVKIKGDNATAIVRLGGKEGPTVRLVLVRRDAGWKIDNFVPKL